MSKNFERKYMVCGVEHTVNMNPKKNKRARRKRPEGGYIKGFFIQGNFWWNGFAKQLIPQGDLTAKEASEKKMIFRRQWYIMTNGAV